MLWKDLVCLSGSLRRIFEVNTRSKIDSSSIISRQLPRQTGNRLSVMLHLHGEMTVTRWCGDPELTANNVKWHSSKMKRWAHMCMWCGSPELIANNVEWHLSRLERWTHMCYVMGSIVDKQDNQMWCLCKQVSTRTTMGSRQAEQRCEVCD